MRIASITVAIALALAAPARGVQAAQLGPNLVANASVETPGASGWPDHWRQGGYGSNTRVFSYPVAGSGGTGTRAISVAITAYTSGDAKWYFDDVPVTGGAIYRFSDASTSDVPSIASVRFTLSTGAYAYKDILSVPPSSSFQLNVATFTAPSNAVSLTVFHVIKQVGTLVTDDYSIQSVSPDPTGSNLVVNPSVETAGASGWPDRWLQGGYGSNTRVFSYPVTGSGGSSTKAISVAITAYTSGDAKWYFADVPVTGSTAYRFSNVSTSDIPSIVNVRFALSNGTYAYQDLLSVPPSSSFRQNVATFTTPPGAVSLTVFHVIKQVGTLVTDDYSIQNVSKGVFNTGAVSFRFDDAVASQYQVAAPALEAAGYRGTFYVISQRTADAGYPAYMTIAQVKDLAARGHEIGAHTRTHPHLPPLTVQQQTDEIAGSRQDLLAWNVGPLSSFAYPFGEYSADTLTIVRNAGFTSAASTNSGYVGAGSDPFQLEYEECRTDLAPGAMQGWVDAAAANHTWLILTFHGLDTSGALYNCTPDAFRQIVDYVRSKGLPVVTVSQGGDSLAR